MLTKTALLTTAIVTFSSVSYAEPDSFMHTVKAGTTLLPEIITDTHGGGCCCSSCATHPIEVVGEK